MSGVWFVLLGVFAWQLVWHLQWITKSITNERGGGSKPQPPQIIQPPPAPSVSQTASESLEAQLKYNPQLTSQQVQLQGQYGPQLAQQQFDLANQYGPMYKAMLTQLYPELGTYQNQVNQRLNSPTGYSPDQQSALDAIRNREQDRGLRGIREGANLGGTLYGGHRQNAESDYLTRQGQAYTAQDIAFQQQQQAANQQALVTLLQLSNPQVQQPNVPQYGQSVVPGGDNLYNALVQNQSNFGVMPGQSSGGINPLTMWYNPKTYGF